MAVAYEPFSPHWRADPYPAFRALRERAPVHYAPESRCWCVARHADVLHVLEHPEDYSSRAMFTILMNGGEDGRPRLSRDALSFMLRFAWRTRLNPLAFGSARS
jgi:cytochrome P450